MKEQLIHILDQSVCLSRKQMKEYLSGTMLPEEMHAAEIHLSACPLCSMAMEGFEEHSDEALTAIASLNSGFLKEHFDNIAPQIHLNSMAPAAALNAAHTGKKRVAVQPLWRAASAAAIVLLAVGTLWYMRTGRSDDAAKRTMAMADNSPAAINAGTGKMSDAQALKQSTAPAANAAQQAPLAAVSELPAKRPVAKTASVPLAPVINVSKNVSRSLASAATNDEPVVSSPAPAAQPEEQVRAQERGNNEATPLRRDYNTERSLAAGGPHITNNNALSRADDNSGLIAKADKSKARNAANAVSQTGDIATLSTTQQAPPAASGSISIGGGRNTGDKYVVDGVQMKPLAASKKPALEIQTRSHLELGDAAYDQGKYSKALTFYNRQMVTGSAKDRSQAAIHAARCYAALGNTAKAKQLLQYVIDEATTGPERRMARRMLRGMD